MATTPIPKPPPIPPARAGVVVSTVSSKESTLDAPLIESQASELGRCANDINVGTTNPGVFYPAKLHLGKSPISITPATPYATLSGQEADFTGYAAAALTWDVPSTASDGTVESVSAPVVFRPTDAVVDDSIYNLWVSNSGGSVWYFAGTIPGGPLPMGSALDQMIVNIRYRPASQTLAVIIS